MNIFSFTILRDRLVLADITACEGLGILFFVFLYVLLKKNYTFVIPIETEKVMKTTTKYLHNSLNFRIFALQIAVATQRNATQRNATQRNATQRNATQRNATQRNATQRNATQRNATPFLCFN